MAELHATDSLTKQLYTAAPCQSVLACLQRQQLAVLIESSSVSLMGTISSLTQLQLIRQRQQLIGQLGSFRL